MKQGEVSVRKTVSYLFSRTCDAYTSVHDRTANNPIFRQIIFTANLSKISV